MEDYVLQREINELKYLVKLILNRLPEDETVEDLVTRLLQDHQNLLVQRQKNA